MVTAHKAMIASDAGEMSFGRWFTDAPFYTLMGWRRLGGVLQQKKTTGQNPVARYLLFIPFPPFLDQEAKRLILLSPFNR